MAVNKPVQDSWRAQTLAVRGGTRRSEFGETGEAIFATSGYVYEYAEQAEDAFRDRVDRFIYSRFSNPTVDMFQDRMALIEGADMGKATATGDYAGETEAAERAAQEAALARQKATEDGLKPPEFSDDELEEDEG